MKKLMFAVAAIAAGAAMAEGITSSNIVGFNTATIKGGAYNMFAVNFQKVGAESAGIGIQDLIPGTTTGLKGGTASTGDQIQIYDPATGNYTIYYLAYYASGPNKAKSWKWLDSKNAISSLTFQNGDTFWYRSKGTTDVTVSLSGGVSLDAAQTIDIVPGYNMIGNAFPAEFNPNVLGTAYWEASGAKGGTASTGDQIQVYDPTTGNYTIYYLAYYASGPNKAKSWKWLDSKNNVTAGILPMGKGAWYRCKATKGFSFTVPSPLAK